MQIFAGKFFAAGGNAGSHGLLPSGSSLTLLLFVLFSTTISQSVIWWAFCLRKVFLLTFARGRRFCHRHESTWRGGKYWPVPWVLAQWGMQVTLLLLATVCWLVLL